MIAPDGAHPEGKAEAVRRYETLHRMFREVTERQHLAELARIAAERELESDEYETAEEKAADFLYR